MTTFLQNGINIDPELQFGVYAVGLAAGSSTIKVTIDAKYPKLNQLHQVSYTAEVALTVSTSSTRASDDVIIV